MLPFERREQFEFFPDIVNQRENCKTGNDKLTTYIMEGSEILIKSKKMITYLITNLNFMKLRRILSRKLN